MDTVGDALFYAFARASDAIAGAESAQEALASGTCTCAHGHPHR